MSTQISAGSVGWEHYQALGEHYDKERPGYPTSAVHEIAGRALSLPHSSRRVVDVGCGTGIFTRMLADALDGSFEVLGLEPSTIMIRRAIEATRTIRPIRFVESPAEKLPFSDRTIGVITAAGAAQLFNRLPFYAEAYRVLVDNGLLAILQNKRRHETGFFQSFELFLERFVPGYRTGTYADARGGHSVANFEAELASDNRFSHVTVQRWDWPRTFSIESFEGFALSTIQLKMARTAHGNDTILKELRSILSDHCDPVGTINVTYNTELTTAVPIVQ
ncbi:class I SAM-dependent methyltransferase [Bradyrhizobium sp. Arg62]|uniref:class I SAM-dependent methyltransferase n=1 Tax=Bradyrhizobium TaxID=374 RepID=UPI001E587982|nr:MULTISPECIES: class I SAM-dependent methyltransferase [Bradyrhizobium]MCC8938652.1 class I SAM-dependent methyltransferase [Bradyrhizobium ivorense]MCC8948623.1 class I SAM-dependent methyltransferase [Bradyrhizobium brasilense]